MMDDNQKGPMPAGIFWRGVFYGAIIGALLIFIPILISAYFHPVRYRRFYNENIFFLMPFIQGCIAGYFTGNYYKSRALAISFVLMVFNFVCAYTFMGEGVICLLMAFPLFLLIIYLGVIFGRLFNRDDTPSKPLYATFTPLILTVAAVIANGPAPEYANAISDAVTINASPEMVWRYVVQYPVNDAPPEYWLWHIGLPAPVQSTATEKAVGAARQCKFTNDIVFEEKITELVPNKVLTFDVTKQPDDPEIIGHFSLDKGQMFLEANADGTTTIVATSWYRIFVKPAGYFDWWAADITRNVHFRVLNHIKHLAEHDAAIAKSAVSVSQNIIDGHRQ